MLDTWNNLIKDCETASRWIADVKAKTEKIVSAFERGEIDESDLYRHFDGVTNKMISLEWEAITAWEHETGEQILPNIYPHYTFIGFYSNRLHALGYCRIYPDDFRGINLSKNIMIAGNGELAINVLAHECLHAILPRKANHGKKFKIGMAVLNRYLGLNVEIRASHVREINRYKYVVYCPHCHEPIKYFERRGKMVKHPEHYYHPKCHTVLKSKPYTEKYMTL